MFECRFVAAMVWHLETRSQPLPRDQGYALAGDLKPLGPPASPDLVTDEPVRAEPVRNAQSAGGSRHQCDKVQRLTHRAGARHSPPPRLTPVAHPSASWR